MAKIAFTSKQFAEAILMNDELDALVLDMASPAEDDTVLDNEPFDHEDEGPAQGFEDDLTDDDVLVMASLIGTDGTADTDIVVETIAEDNVLEALEEGSAPEVVLETEASELVQAPEALTETRAHTAADFDTRLAAVTQEEAIAKAIEIGNQIDERVEFERSKGNETIQKHLAKSRKQLASPAAARVMIACNVDIREINRVVHEGNRYNVYALGKLADAVYALAGGVLGNAINNACMRSLFQFRAAGQVFNGEMAKAAASDKIRIEPSIRRLLVSHTVSASTASTQASSTMQALTTLGIVTRSGSQKNPIFTLANTDTVAKLDAVLKAA